MTRAGRKNRRRIMVAFLFLALLVLGIWIILDETQTLRQIQQHNGKIWDEKELAEVKSITVLDSPPAPPQTLDQLSSLSSCYKTSQKAIREEGFEQRREKLPLLASLIQAPSRQEVLGTDSSSAGTFHWTATFSLCDITWLKKGILRKRIPEFSKNSDWSCNGYPATVVGGGCPNGTTLTLQCPSNLDPVETITYRNYTYHVKDISECYKRNPITNLSVNPFPASDNGPTIVASVIAYHVSNTTILEWIVYHHDILGVDHFWVYVLDDMDFAHLPLLEYVTYIPWNVNPFLNNTKSTWEIFLFQTASQVDSLHRARSFGTVEWVMYLDLDEFLELRNNFTLLKEYLKDDSMALNDDVAAIQVQTVAFGQNRARPSPRDFQMDYTYRSVNTFGPNRRCKSIVRPRLVDYYNIHWAVSPEEIMILKPSPDDIWIHHYKFAHKGVFRRGLSNRTIVRDSYMRDKYALKVQMKVAQLLKNHPT
jgi:hypothetical protein